MVCTMSTRNTSDVWHNWARTESATPTRVARPRDLDELVATVRDSHGLHVRAVGAGHSFTGGDATG